MKETLYEYFDGEKTASVSDLDSLAKIMNLAEGDPDIIDASKICEIVRIVFPMSGSATETHCVALWHEFLAFMYARSVVED